MKYEWILHGNGQVWSYRRVVNGASKTLAMLRYAGLTQVAFGGGKQLWGVVFNDDVGWTTTNGTTFDDLEEAKAWAQALARLS